MVKVESTMVIAYVPVVHQGYLRFFESHPPSVAIGILSEELTQTYEPLQKDIRSLSSVQIVTSLQSLLPTRQILLIDQQMLATLNSSAHRILLPDEDISHQVAEEYLDAAQLEFSSVFLRWDRTATSKVTPPTPEATTSVSELTQKWVSLATELGQTSADWWRRVGAVLVKDGQVLLKAVNHHLPHQQQPYIMGDPRANFHKKEKIELSTAIHAEASLIAQAAKLGLSVAGAQLYVSTFPCPVCAKLVAESGIRELYYAEGYAMLEGEAILAANKVKVIAVDLGLSQA